MGILRKRAALYKSVQNKVFLAHGYAVSQEHSAVSRICEGEKGAEGGRGDAGAGLEIRRGRTRGAGG